MMRLNPSISKLINPLLLALLAALLLLLVAALARPVEIDAEFEGATIHISADRGWVLIPGDCLQIRWQVEGIESIYIDGQGKIGWGDMTYCPRLGGADPEFLITAQNGAVRAFTLELITFNDFLICLCLVAILSLFLLAGYYLLWFRMDKPVPVAWSALLLFAIAALACLLRLGTAYGIFSVREALRSVGDAFASPTWQLFGIVLGAMVFAPLIVQSMRRGIKTKTTADFVAIAGFFGIVLLLYLPFGFEYIDLWENWVFQAYLEGRPSRASFELASRFWTLVPVTLASLIHPNSFAGFHIVHALLFLGKMALLYGILRRLGFSSFVAFLCSLLFFLYPVNSGLVFLRALPYTFSSLSLLAAAYLAMDYGSNPSRLRLLGIWLALLYSIGANESGYIVILIAPILWWRRPSRLQHKLNLSFAWYLFPAAKLVYLLLWITSGAGFYRSGLLGSLFDSERSLLGWFAHYVGILGDVYLRTFATGWQEALNVVSQNQWVAPTLAALFIAGVASIYLARDSEASALPSRRQALIGLIGGALFVLPSIGVLMWVERFNQGLWRMYIYVPIGAAVAILSLLLLMTSIIEHLRVRKLVIVAASLLLIFPATSRLFLQHANVVDSANIKAGILAQIVKQAPAIDSDAYIILLTDMTGSELRSRGISELRTNMLDGSMYVLYAGHGPQITFLCMMNVHCYLDDAPLRNFSFHEDTAFSKLALFRLREDLSVQLLRELPPELGLDDRGAYNPDRLIDASAPLPPRAVTMLGAAIRDD